MRLPKYFIPGIFVGIAMFGMVFLQFHNDFIRGILSGATLTTCVWIVPDQDLMKKVEN